MLKYLIPILLLISLDGFSQKIVSLSDFILMSEESLDGQINNKNIEIIDNENLLFQKSFLPQFALDFNVPNYNRSISPVLQPDGSYAFRESNTANSRIDLRVDQKIPFTGGDISISNSLSRLDVFGESEDEDETTYSASWLNINLIQPLNFYNPMKWDKKIAESEMEINNFRQLKSKIELKGVVVTHYFEILEIRKRIESLNLELNRSKEYSIYLNKLIESGKSFPDDLIDIQLKILSRNQDLIFMRKQERIKLDYLKIFFEKSEFVIDEEDKLLLPKIISEFPNVNFYIDAYIDLYSIFKSNRLLGLEKKVEELRKKRYYTANIVAGFGLNNATEDASNVFKNPSQSQNISLSISTPIIDFGKRKTELKIVNIQREVENISLKKEKAITIEQIRYLYEEIENILVNLDIENQRHDLIKIKLEREKLLLFNRRSLLKDFNDIESKLAKTEFNKIQLLSDLYIKSIELENVTLISVF